MKAASLLSWGLRGLQVDLGSCPQFFLWLGDQALCPRSNMATSLLHLLPYLSYAWKVKDTQSWSVSRTELNQGRLSGECSAQEAESDLSRELQHTPKSWARCLPKYKQIPAASKAYNFVWICFCFLSWAYLIFPSITLVYWALVAFNALAGGNRAESQMVLLIWGGDITDNEANKTASC